MASGVVITTKLLAPIIAVNCFLDSIKLLLPSIEEELGEEDDPRAELIRRLQEYERYKKASFNLDALPRIDRDFYILNKQLLINSKSAVFNSG